jgi:4-hydroxy-tetrahydrodipicolinate synthase
MTGELVRKLEGIIPIVNTTFHEDGSLDLESQRSLVRHLLGQRVHGIALFGNASEGYALTEAERKRILELVIDEVAGRIPVIVSSGHTGTYPAVEMSVAAAEAGADALMVLPPYLLKPDGPGTYDYFAEISKAVKIPIMVQDAPLMTQVNMPAPLLARMAREIENVAYVKVEAPPTTVKITELVASAGESVVAFGGLNGNFLIEELDRGAAGTMPGSDLCAEFVGIWDLYQAGDKAGARCEFRRLLPTIRFELQPGLGVSAMKTNLVAEGVIASNTVRSPTRKLDEAGVRELEQLRADRKQ